MKRYIVARELIDGKHDEPLKNQVITIEDGEISAVSPLASVDANLLTDDCTYKVAYALPGLFDCHNHLACDVGDQEDQMRQHTTYISARAIRNARMELLTGVTTMRTCGEKDGIDYAYRRAINEWVVPGPRVLASGAQIVITGGHCWRYQAEQADGVLGMTEIVRRRRRDGADFIKAMVSGGMMTPNSDFMAAEMTLEELKAMVNEAKRWGKRTAVHVHGGPAVDYAIEAGVTTIEHCGFATREQLEKLAKSGQYIVATINDVKVYGEQGEKYGVPVFAREKCKTAFKSNCSTFSAARELGVKVVVGQDCIHGRLPEELVTLVKDCGWPEMYAIKAATALAAEACGLDGLTGTIEPGKSADIVAVDDSPLKDITALRKMAMVMREGKACLYNGRVLV